MEDRTHFVYRFLTHSALVKSSEMSSQQGPQGISPIPSCVTSGPNCLRDAPNILRDDFQMPQTQHIPSSLTSDPNWFKDALKMSRDGPRRAKYNPRCIKIVPKWLNQHGPSIPERQAKKPRDGARMSQYSFEMIPDPLNDSTMAPDSLKNVTAEVKKVGSAE